MNVAGLPSDAAIVRKLNEIFYDVEAEQYDERHPEVIEGDADWWSSRCGALLRELKSEGAGPVAILDLGCGTGFVSGLLAEHLDAGDLVVGVDQSARMLERARAKLSERSRGICRFVRGDAASLNFPDRSFDLIAVNSFLHHVYDYGAVLREADRVLKPGGHLVLAHEPNRAFFQSRFVRLLGSAWKLAGFGMKLPRELCDEVNARLRAARLATSAIAADDILRLVEYHSPVEQGAVRIDKDKGFSIEDLLEGELKGYRLIECNLYSTFYHRPLLERTPWLKRIAMAGAGFLDGRGNLFSAVLRKQ